MVDLPDPVMELGLNVTVCPLPWPDAERATADPKPPVAVRVMVDVPEELRATVIEVGDAERLKPAVGEVTVSATVVEWLALPLVPVIVML